MQTQQLSFHPAQPPLVVRGIQARWSVVGPWLQLRWRIERSDKVLLPPFSGRVRRDGLWQTTCFEVFVKSCGGKPYAEFNFSPSEAFAAYDFDCWRESMRERKLSRDPVITPRGGSSLLLMDVALPITDLPALPAALSLTCVIEEEGGRKSYWAMAHGKSDKPDFHDPACFAATLEPPSSP